MKAMIRSIDSWKALVMRLVGAVPSEDLYFIGRMHYKIVSAGEKPTEAEAIRLETLAEKYRAAI